MCWKKMPYWLKGGILFIFFTIISLVLVMFIGEFLMNIICGEPPIINGEEYPACNSVENVILFIFDFSIIFLIGAIIGLVYEKIKNKKKKIKKVRKR